jgi:light-regulated signal transduction histidine kinase (bacteriophytochrome)
MSLFRFHLFDHPANLVQQRLSGVAFEQYQRLINTLRSARPDDLLGTIKASPFQLFKLIEPLPSSWIVGGHVAQFPEIKVGTRFAAVRVSDTGVGLAPDVLPHIFEPFYTTKEVGHGVGLGLAVSRRIVEEHGGWIDAANRPEGGAVFTIYLPRVDTPNVAAPGQSAE